MEPPGKSQNALAAYRGFAELQERFASLAPLPKDTGRVVSIVCRHAPGVHEALSRVHLSPEMGVPGDQWNRRLPLNLDAQLAVFRHDVAELLGNGQPLSTSGDNLIVDFDISAGNLPQGTRLQVGEAVVEVTPKPHNGCHKFASRFGPDALRFVQAPETRHQNLRGMYWRVIQLGQVSVGSPIKVISRSS